MKLNRSQKRKAVKAGIPMQRTIDLKNEITGATVQAIVIFSQDLEPTLTFVENDKDVIYKVPALEFMQVINLQVHEALTRLKEALTAND
jgi:hypothetical protein